MIPASDGGEAVEILATGERVALVVLDLMMPRMDGRQTLSLLRENHPGLPVVLCSGYSQQELHEEWKGVFLAKPYTRENLKGAMLRALAGGH